MAILTEAPAATLTYEAYMAEPEVQGRYEIIHGVRVCMPGATWRHQRIAKRIEQALDRYEESAGEGLNVSAPFDVLVHRYRKRASRMCCSLAMHGSHGAAAFPKSGHWRSRRS